MHVWGARANQRHTRHHRSSQGCASDLCMCSRVCGKEISTHSCTCTCACTAAQPYLKGVRVCTTCASVCAAIISLIHPLCLSVCLYVHVRVSWCLYTQCWGAIHVQQASDDRSNTCHIHSYVHTLTHIQHFHSRTVNSHEKHAHLLKRWKPDKSAVRQGRQLVVTQFKASVSRRNRELNRQLSCILRNANKQIFVYIYKNTNTHKYASLYVWLHEERERISVTLVITAALKGVRAISACAHVCVLTAVVHAHKSGQTKNKYVHSH
jgi:uncharacterized membrane protein